jgi:hypothetical protein
MDRGNRVAVHFWTLATVPAPSDLACLDQGNGVAVIHAIADGSLHIAYAAMAVDR